MQRYVGGFQTFDRPGPAPFHHGANGGRAPRARETNRQASFTLVVVAVAVTVIILVALIAVRC